MAKVDFSKLKSLLEAQESFPLHYRFKFVGRNSEFFENAVEEFEASHPELTSEGRIQSSNGAFTSLTYSSSFASADAIIALMEGVAQLKDVVMIL